MTSVLFAFGLLALQEESLESLLRRLDAPEISAREEAVRALAARPLKDLPVLEKAFANEKDAERRGRLQRVVWSVRLKKHAPFVKTLSESRLQSDQTIVKALTTLQPQEAVSELNRAVPEHAGRIVDVLVEVFSEDAELFTSLLRNHGGLLPPDAGTRALPYFGHPDQDILREVTQYFIRMKLEEKRLPGITWEKVKAEVTRVSLEKGHPGRRHALEALLYIGGPEEIDQALQGAAGAGPEVEVEAIKTFAVSLRPGDPRARKAEALLGSRIPVVRRLVYQSLAVHPNPEVDSPRVRKALLEEPPKVRFGALILATATKDESLLLPLVRIVPEKDGPKTIETIFKLSPLKGAQLVSQFYTHHPGVTEAWIKHLNEYGTPEVRKAIHRSFGQVLRDASPKKRESRLWTAWELDAYYDAELLDACLKDEDNTVQESALKRVGSIRGEPGADLVRSFLKHPDAAFRREAIRAMGRTTSPLFSDDLIRLLDNALYRKDVLEAIVKRRDRRALPKMRELLEWKARLIEVAEALGEIGEERDAALVLRSAPHVPEKESRKRLILARAAVRLLGPNAVEGLRPFVRDRRTRVPAIQALAELDGAGAAAEDVAGFLDDSNDAVVRNAVIILGKGNHEDSLFELAKLLEDKSIGSHAARALAGMSRDKVEPLVEPLLEDPSWVMRHHAARILFGINSDVMRRKAGSLLRDSAALVRVCGLETVHRDKLSAHYDRVYEMTLEFNHMHAEDAVAAISALDWKNRRDALLARLADPEEKVWREIAEEFGKHHDPAAVKEIAWRIDDERDAGYHALVLLNAFRAPDAYSKAAEKKYSGWLFSTFDSAWDSARELEEQSGVPFRVEIPPPEVPPVTYDSLFGKNADGIGVVGSGGGGGGRMKGRGGARNEFSLLFKIEKRFAKKWVPVLEKDHIRILPRYKAVEFWRAWVAGQKE